MRASAVALDTTRLSCWAHSFHPPLQPFPVNRLEKSALGPYRLHFHVSDKTHELRPALDSFISGHYLRSFGSPVQVDYPLVLSIAANNGDIQAAVGLRQASVESLFLEQYLGERAEVILARRYQKSAFRDRIIELGNLASTKSTASIYLIGAAALYMSMKEFEFALVTATGRLRRLFSLFDFELSCLGSASKESLIDPSRDWGSYYDNGPKVLAAPVSHCRDAVMNCAAIFGNPARMAVFLDIMNQMKTFA